MAKDLFHNAVRRGLEKEQWKVTDDPLELELEEITLPKWRSFATKSNSSFTIRLSKKLSNG
jgi:hypothetical protein